MILGGTLEATALTKRMAEMGVRAVLSLAGRVDRPKAQALPLRVRGFGGVSGLEAYIVEHGVTHVVDATHPFASQMSRNAVAACKSRNVPLVAFTRAPWLATEEDNWQTVPDIAGAVAALDQPAKRVFLAIGRMHLAEFASVPQHEYLVRLVDPPTAPIPFPHVTVRLDRGPFTVEGDAALLCDHGTDLIVSKNSGGTGAVSKILAARDLGLPVIMIERPPMPQREEAHSVDEVIQRLRAHGADLGV